ncbi:hypothetical protein J4462_01290 [Candidatus Pacearchaeota archaeon]|nr:hypothetical protein [Candidatus Pacearchaeota archaeon]
MVNKKGFLRIAEATISIMIILGFLLILNVNNEVRVERNLAETLPPFLEEVARDPELRLRILEYDTTESSGYSYNEWRLGRIQGFLDERIKNSSFGYDVRICELDKVCPLVPYPVDAEEIFASERAVTTSVQENLAQQNFAPKKLKLFLWRRVV